MVPDMFEEPSFWGEPVWVSEEIIRERFNAGQFEQRVQRGDLSRRVLRPDNHLSRRQRLKIGEPRCTRSQMVLYRTTEGKPVALVHRYRRRTGELGGSGMADPKRLFICGEVIAVREIPDN